MARVFTWPRAMTDRFLVLIQGEARGRQPAEGAEGPIGGRAIFHGIYFIFFTNIIS